VAQAIVARKREGKHFSIVAVAEGAAPKRGTKKSTKSTSKKNNKDKAAGVEWGAQHMSRTMHLAEQLELLTGLESRVSILGYLQRGGAPSAGDRTLAARLGTACAALIDEGAHGVMIAARGDGTTPVPLEDVVGKRKSVPLSHSWIESARLVGTSLGD
jgi:6-phosphofructokinase 1